MSKENIDRALGVFERFARLASGWGATRRGLAGGDQTLGESDEVEIDDAVSDVSLKLRQALLALTMVEILEFVEALTLNFGDTATEEGEHRLRQLKVYFEMYYGDSQNQNDDQLDI